MHGRRPAPTWFDIVLGAMLGIKTQAARTHTRRTPVVRARSPVYDFLGAQQNRLLLRVEEALDEVSQQLRDAS